MQTFLTRMLNILGGLSPYIEILKDAEILLSCQEASSLYIFHGTSPFELASAVYFRLLKWYLYLLFLFLNPGPSNLDAPFLAC